MLHIKNCQIIDQNGILNDEILIEKGKIRMIGSEKIKHYIYDSIQKLQIPGLEDAEDTKPLIKTIDANNNIVMPSFVDLHFHMRNPGQSHKETLLSGNKAALKGGYTHVLAMANTNPVVDSRELVEDMLTENRKLNLIKLFQVSSVTKNLEGKELVDFLKIREMTRFFSDDGKNIDDPKLLEYALYYSRDLDFVILSHDEPETEMVQRNLDIVRKTKGNFHFCHISKEQSMKEIIKAKEEGLNITVEVAPHHIYKSDIDYRVNPPFATESDRKFLIKAIKEGYVDAIATDHAPHTIEDKANGAPGISGIETSFSLCHKVFKEEELGMDKLSKLMSYNPGRFLGLSHREIRAGEDADIVIIKEGSFNIYSKDFESKGKNTPFENDSVEAIVTKTIRKGELLYDNGLN